MVSVNFQKNEKVYVASGTKQVQTAPFPLKNSTPVATEGVQVGLPSFKAAGDTSAVTVKTQLTTKDEKKKYKGLSMNFWLKRFDYNKNEYTKDVKDASTLTWSDEKATWEYDEVWDVNGERKFKEWMYVAETYTMDDCISYFYNSTNPTFHFGEDTAKGAEVYNHYYCYVTEDAPGNEGICQYEFFWGFNVDGYLNHYDISWMHDKIHDSIEIGCSYYE